MHLYIFIDTRILKNIQEKINRKLWGDEINLSNIIYLDINDISYLDINVIPKLFHLFFKELRTYLDFSKKKKKNLSWTYSYYYFLSPYYMQNEGNENILALLNISKVYSC